MEFFIGRFPGILDMLLAVVNGPGRLLCAALSLVTFLYSQYLTACRNFKRVFFPGIRLCVVIACCALEGASL